MKQIEAYLNVLRTGNKSENTIRSYTKDISKFVNHFNITEVKDIENLEVEQYHDFYASQNMTENSTSALIRNLSAFFTWLVDSKYISSDNAFFHVKFGKSRFPKVNKKKKTVLTTEEAEMLISAGRNLQEKFMLSMMLKTALRREEVCNIKLSDISGCTISLKSKGGDESHETYLDEELCNLLNEYLNERKSDSEYLFYPTRGVEDTKEGKLSGESVNNRVKACALASGMPKEKAEALTAHRLRAYAITFMVRKKGLYAGQVLARHRSDTTTKLYVNTGNDYLKELLLENRDNKTRLALESVVEE